MTKRPKTTVRIRIQDKGRQVLQIHWFCSFSLISVSHFTCLPEFNWPHDQLYKSAMESISFFFFELLSHQMQSSAMASVSCVNNQLLYRKWQTMRNKMNNNVGPCFEMERRKGSSMYSITTSYFSSTDAFLCSQCSKFAGFIVVVLWNFSVMIYMTACFSWSMHG